MALLLWALLAAAALILLEESRAQGAPQEVLPILELPEISPPEGDPMLPLPGGHNQWDNQIRYACLVNGLLDDARMPLLVKAIIEHESAHTWNPEILGDRRPADCPGVYPRHPTGITIAGARVSTAGYCGLGLMQVNRNFHPDLAAAYDLLDGAEGILAGTSFVAALYRRYHGDAQQILAAYNGGSGAGDAWPQVSSQVRSYVNNVSYTLQRYAAAAGVAV